MSKPKTVEPIIKKHLLIPKHSKLSDKEKAHLLETYKVTIRELPKILIKDPAIADLDAKAGDIIEIKRNSPTAGETVFYRVVSDV